MATSVTPLSADPPAGPAPVRDPILQLREASRKLVREWGFLRPTPVPFPLSPAAVHCLIEIGDYGWRAFPDLCTELNVSPAQASRMLVELVSAGLVRRERQGSSAARNDETYVLTASGEKTLAEINTYARDQVAKALAAAPPGVSAVDFTKAFQAYGAALERSRPVGDTPTPDLTPSATPEVPSSLLPAPPTVSLVTGYRPGLLARSLEMNVEYYYPRNGWGRKFEVVLSASLGDVLDRLGNPVNQVWSAVTTTPSSEPGAPPQERTVGTIYVDGECPGRPNVARLRGFIVDGSARGLGVGKKLLDAAMKFIKDGGFTECFLTTQASLTVARKLYEREGFVNVKEDWYEGFGPGTQQVTYVWHRPRDL
ncbi:uncharacterized protein C8A04DRAFT_12528 [Dichotomopilus funicola]|uniref:N-acetyltransferase domain-containing protein n=1 Tax=Dichotomopilus funicola TaxID=1934379 RepID=A0AAN6ZN68_9PEZI|nr:hypothetical protein C8A04DRAFT_12528 [Dichotomopilus funicola]